MAKALAIGADAPDPDQGPVVLVTVDNCGVPGHVTDEVARRLEKSTGLPRVAVRGQLVAHPLRPGAVRHPSGHLRRAECRPTRRSGSTDTPAS